MYEQEKLEKIRWINSISRTYMFTNLTAAFLTGVSIGYAQEKAGQPYSATDVGFQLGVPAMIQAGEYLTLDRVLRTKDIWREGKKEELTRHITNSNIGGVGTFLVGDYVGRVIAIMF